VPIYKFRCDKCNCELEKLCDTFEATQICLNCGNEMSKVFGKVNVKPSQDELSNFTDNKYADLLVGRKATKKWEGYSDAISVRNKALKEGRHCAYDFNKGKYILLEKGSDLDNISKTNSTTLKKFKESGVI